jgi:Pyruvate/2-oxoacid:ferredoxin oxidoreductase delta subunit
MLMLVSFSVSPATIGYECHMPIYFFHVYSVIVSFIFVCAAVWHLLSVHCSYIVHGERKVCKYRTTQNLEQMKQSLCLIQRGNLMNKEEEGFSVHQVIWSNSYCILPNICSLFCFTKHCQKENLQIIESQIRKEVEGDRCGIF